MRDIRGWKTGRYLFRARNDLRNCHHKARRKPLGNIYIMTCTMFQTYDGSVLSDFRLGRGATCHRCDRRVINFLKLFPSACLGEGEREREFKTNEVNNSTYVCFAWYIFLFSFRQISLDVISFFHSVYISTLLVKLISWSSPLFLSFFLFFLFS